jgi:hypothetical protein
MLLAAFALAPLAAPAAAQDRTLPAADADWHGWTPWTRGLVPPFRPFGLTFTSTPGWQLPATAVLRAEIAASGRDVPGELRRAFAAAQEDTAKLVLGTILLALGAHQPDTADVAARLRSPSREESRLGWLEMQELLRTAPATSWAAEPELLDGLLRFSLAREEPWPRLDPTEARRRYGPDGWGPGVFLRSDSLPSPVRERWRGRAELLSVGEWRERPVELGGILFQPTSILRAGPFAALSLKYDGRLQLPPGTRRATYAGGVTVYLLRTAEGWSMISFEDWMT